MAIPTYSKEEYENGRPNGEQKIEFNDCVVRAYVRNGELHIVAHRKSSDGHEELPLGYMLGSNALIFKLRKT